jgi:hypothetical protein
MNLREPAGARTDLGLALEIMHHAHYRQILLRIRRLPYATAQTTVHGGSV